MNDEPCMCGTDFTCMADVHLVTTKAAAAYLGISARGLRLAVTRKKLRYAGRDEQGYVFKVADLDTYAATRSARPLAERH